MNRYHFYGCVAAISVGGVTTAAVAQAASGNAFNPAFSVIFDGQYANYSRDPAKYAMSGFLLGDEAGPAPKGLSLGETELAASANVDDRFYAQMAIALDTDGDKTTVNIEEAFLQTTSLPAGFTIKAGRFFSDIGYLNSKHAHAWDFVDQPLAYKAMLNSQFGDDGVQFRWVAPIDLLVEVGSEAYRGTQFPTAGATHGGIGAWTAFAHVGGDISNTQSWRTGVSYLHADALGRASTIPNGDVIDFTGGSHVAIVDFVWKWADHGNPKTRNLVFQAEYLRRQESGTVVDTNINYATAIFPPPFVVPNYAYSGTQQGFYVQGIWQFIPQWRVGLRYDKLSADNHGPSLGVTIPFNDTHDPTRVTAMLDFSNSEFSRFRLQVAEDKSQPQSDTQVTFQYIMSIGAHGAHQF